MNDAERLQYDGLWAVLPVKDLVAAKQRLSALLGAAERARLYRAMLEGVLEALAATPEVSGTLVVTRDPDAAEMARGFGARVLHEDRNRGHTAASTHGARWLAARGAYGMLQLPGDLPLLGAADLSLLVAGHRAAPAVTLAPSRDRRGTNAVLCSPPDLLPLRFGEDSFEPHLARARALGITPAVVERAGLALDVDTPQDLAALLAHPGTSRAQAYLRTSGIARRVQAAAQPALP